MRSCVRIIDPGCSRKKARQLQKQEFRIAIPAPCVRLAGTGNHFNSLLSGKQELPVAQ